MKLRTQSPDALRLLAAIALMLCGCATVPAPSSQKCVNEIVIGTARPDADLIARLKAGDDRRRAESQLLCVKGRG